MAGGEGEDGEEKDRAATHGAGRSVADSRRRRDRRWSRMATSEGTSTMKKIALLLALTAFSVPLHARSLARLSRMTTGNPASITFSDVDPQLPARLLAQLRARRVARVQGVHA